MAESTARMNFTYPNFRKSPWFNDFDTLVGEIDASVYTTREDRNLVLAEGGTVSWNAGTGELTWDDVLYLNASITGFLWRVQPTTMVLAEGELFYIELTRNPGANLDVVTGVASQVPPTDAGIMLCIRVGDRLYWRDGKVVNDGFSGSLFTASVGGPVTLDLASVLVNGNLSTGRNIEMTAGDALRMQPGSIPLSALLKADFFVSDGSGGLVSGEPYYRYSLGAPQRLIGGSLGVRTLATNEQCDGVTSLIQVGQFAFDPTLYGVERRFRIEYVLSVNDALRTATATLYNLTDSESVTGTVLTTQNTAPTKLNSGDLTVGSGTGNLKSSEKLYEIRLENDGSVGAELSFMGSAVMQVF